MSLVKIQGNASGTGEFTIAAPNSNTNRTLTLPDNTGTILTSATTTGFPAGSVLQVVSATYSTYTVISSTSYTDTGLSASITPTSSSSKILVIVSQQNSVYRDTNSVISGGISLVRGSTTILYSERTPMITAGTSSTSNIITGGRQSIVYLDSPATTSSTTYKTQGQVSTTSNGGALRVNDYQDVSGTTVSTITLMEIAA
jgi:hypothetical protein